MLATALEAMLPRSPVLPWLPCSMSVWVAADIRLCVCMCVCMCACRPAASPDECGGAGSWWASPFGAVVPRLRTPACFEDATCADNTRKLPCADSGVLICWVFADTAGAAGTGSFAHHSHACACGQPVCVDCGGFVPASCHDRLCRVSQDHIPMHRGAS